MVSVLEDRHIMQLHHKDGIKCDIISEKDLLCFKIVYTGILRPDKRRWAVLSLVQPLDKYICKSASQVTLFAYSPICETLHTKSIYL